MQTRVKFKYFRSQNLHQIYKYKRLKTRSANPSSQRKAVDRKRTCKLHEESSSNWEPKFFYLSMLYKKTYVKETFTVNNEEFTVYKKEMTVYNQQFT